MSRRLTRQRKAIARLAGGKLVEISSEMAIRFRHVQHKLVRLSDEASAIDRRLADLMTSAAGLTARKSWI
jgi:Mg2+ and Co2+ transporter CorA